MLGALVISETSQLPKPPVMAGITVKEKTEGVGCHCCVVDSGVSEPCSGSDLIQHELVGLRENLLFQPKHQLINIRGLPWQSSG